MNQKHDWQTDSKIQYKYNILLSLLQTPRAAGRAASVQSSLGLEPWDYHLHVIHQLLFQLFYFFFFFLFPPGVTAPTRPSPPLHPVQQSPSILTKVTDNWWVGRSWRRNRKRRGSIGRNIRVSGMSRRMNLHYLGKWEIIAPQGDLLATHSRCSSISRFSNNSC